jgi:hypothetical protein
MAISFVGRRESCAAAVVHDEGSHGVLRCEDGKARVVQGQEWRHGEVRTPENPYRAPIPGAVASGDVTRCDTP